MKPKILKPSYQFKIIDTEPFVRGKEPIEVTFPDNTRKIIYSWDYKTIFSHPYLYERLYGEFLKLDSPRIIWSYFLDVLLELGFDAPLRILDIAAGSGMMGVEARKSYSRCEFLMGLDVLEEARNAALRDHPGIYDQYCLMKLDALGKEELESLISPQFNTVFIVSATGGSDEDDLEDYEDVGLKEYKTILSLVESESFIVFNVREHYTVGQKLILEYLAPQCSIVGEKVHFHRYLTNGEPVNFKTFVMRTN